MLWLLSIAEIGVGSTVGGWARAPPPGPGGCRPGGQLQPPGPHRQNPRRQPQWDTISHMSLGSGFKSHLGSDPRPWKAGHGESDKCHSMDTPWTHTLPCSCLARRLHSNIYVGQVLGSPNLSTGADQAWQEAVYHNG